MTNPINERPTDDERLRADYRLRISRDLRAIVEMYADLAVEAEHHPSSSEMPGGDATNLLGPVANLEAWNHRYDAAEAADAKAASKSTQSRASYVSDQVDTEDHPLLVLATWEDLIRDERDQPTDLRATVDRAADYLRGSLDWMLRTDEHGGWAWLAVDQVAADLARVRSRLESVLHAGVRADRGAPCLECGTALVKDWGVTPEADRWRCWTCDDVLTPELYLQAVRDAYLQNAEKLTATQIEHQYLVPSATVRRWFHDGRLSRAGRDQSGRILYRVSDVLALRAERDTPAQIGDPA